MNRISVVAVFGREQYKDDKKKDQPSLNISISSKVQNDYYKGQKYFIATIKQR